MPFFFLENHNLKPSDILTLTFRNRKQVFLNFFEFFSVFFFKRILLTMVNWLFKIAMWIAVFKLTIADVALLSPVEGATYGSNDERKVTIKLKWIENNAEPKVSSIDSLIVALCTGPNDNITQVAILEDSLAPEDTTEEGKKEDKSWSYNLTFSSDLTDDGMYYLQLVSLVDDVNWFTIHYSSRFLLQNMTHAKNESLIHGSMDYPPLPATETNKDGSSSSMDLQSLYTIPYQLQTGTIKYAPMQPMPLSVWLTERWKEASTKDTSTTRIKPYVTYGSKPNAEYTLTEPPTYTLHSSPNTLAGIATHQAHYDPSKRIKSTPRLRQTAVSTQS